MLKLTDLKKDIFSGVFLKKIAGFFVGNFKLFVFLLFVGLSGYCVYLWYFYSYAYQWNADQKKAYLETKDKDVTFNRQKFQEIIDEENKRAKEQERSITVERDIFGIK
jgi:Ca2+/Na+ antiporter